MAKTEFIDQYLIYVLLVQCPPPSRIKDYFPLLASEQDFVTALMNNDIRDTARLLKIDAKKCGTVYSCALSGLLPLEPRLAFTLWKNLRGHPSWAPASPLLLWLSSTNFITVICRGSLEYLIWKSTYDAFKRFLSNWSGPITLFHGREFEVQQVSMSV